MQVTPPVLFASIQLLQPPGSAIGSCAANADCAALTEFWSNLPGQVISTPF